MKYTKELLPSALKAREVKLLYDRLIKVTPEEDFLESQIILLHELASKAEINLIVQKKALATSIFPQVLIPARGADCEVLLSAGFESKNAGIKLHTWLGDFLTDFLVPETVYIPEEQLFSLSGGEGIDLSENFISKLNELLEQVGVSVTFNKGSRECFSFSRVEEAVLV